ncbi:MAG: T9SS type A sorting domain-containing protein [Bacteroidetes bacterium]|nr:T9SS type A sorting domain-containing protein [Bacteroidota bacterium]
MKTKLLIVFIALCTIANAQNTWIQKPLFGGGFRSDDVGFAIGSKGYIGTGWSNTALTKDIWAYDTLTNAWTQVADFGGSPRSWAVGFAIGTKGFIGTGLDTCSVCQARKKDFWEYNSTTNIWTQKSDFGGTARYLAVGFSIGAKGYIGTGNDGVNENDFWEYDTTSDSWSQKAFFGGLERNGAFGFSIGTKGYIGGGSSNYNDFWEYNPSNDTWAQKANVIVYDPFYAAAFSIGNYGYVLTDDSGAGSDFGEYDPITNTWILVANLASPRNEGVGFSIGNRGYIGTGHDGSGRKKDFWKYTPCSSFPTATITASGPTTFCSGGSVTLTASTGNSYQWWSSQTTQSIVVSTSGSYAVIITDSCGTATSSPVVVTVNPSPTVTITPSLDTICVGESVILSASPNTNYLWSTSATTSSISVAPTTTTFYSVSSTGANGCIGMDTANIIVLTCTGVSQLENNNDFIIYPDPSNGIFNLNSQTANGEISVCNVLGEIIFQSKINSPISTIDLSSQSSGIYLMTVKTEKKSFTQKIIIQ